MKSREGEIDVGDGEMLIGGGCGGGGGHGQGMGKAAWPKPK